MGDLQASLGRKNLAKVRRCDALLGAAARFIGMGPRGPPARPNPALNAMRFYVYKRALMLTAATMALLSGPAYAADNNKPLTTSTAGTSGGAGDIDLTSALTIPSSSTANTVPAITIDSNNNVTVEANGSMGL